MSDALLPSYSLMGIWTFATPRPVSGLEVRARTGTERDVELVPQEQVLDQKFVPLPEKPCQHR
jgi:hypothetical protein